MKLHPVFKPVRKFDRVRSVNLFPDAISVFFERNERIGTGWQKVEYVKVAHPSVVPNVRVNWKIGVTRILFQRPGALLTAMATGKVVRLEPWTSNGSDNTKAAGLNVESLVFEVEGYGYYSLDKITDMTSGDFDLFGPGVAGRWNNAEHTQKGQEFAKIDRHHYCDMPVAGYYPPAAPEAVVS